MQFKRNERFRDEYHYANSDAAIRRFPFPFADDAYRYSVNLEPHVRGAPGSVYQALFDIDEHYLGELQDRAITLQRDPLRCQVLPHLRIAQWDLLELLMESLSTDYPDWFGLDRDGDLWHWRNRLLGVDDRFVFGDESSLPLPPFEYITRQVQGDFCLCDQRDEQLYLDGGMLTSPADWSLDFDLGMNFFEWHAPVPMAHESRVFERALKYLMRLQQGAPVRRLNWTTTVNPRLDTAPETYADWVPERQHLNRQNAGERLFLRVELQTLFRLPRSGAILFSIRTYLISLAELARVPGWARRLRRVLLSLPPEIVAYKGLARNRDIAAHWLARFEDDAGRLRGVAAGGDPGL